MKDRPVDFKKNASYHPLIINGRILLDHEDCPVRDIPGLPLTLSTKIEPWILEGIRRSLPLGLKE